MRRPTWCKEARRAVWGLGRERTLPDSPFSFRGKPGKRCVGLACAFGLMCLLSSPLAGQTQETPKVELFAGYSYFPLKGAPDAHGFHLSVTANVTRHVGLSADFSQHFASEEVNQPFQPSTRRIRLYFLQFGPRVRLKQTKRLEVSAHSLFGVSHTSVRLFSRSTPGINVPSSNTGFGMTLGGALDTEINPRLSVRLIRADYVFSRLAGFNHHDYRYSGGIVFRLGRLSPRTQP
jgi:hypothetical protein